MSALHLNETDAPFLTKHAAISCPGRAREEKTENLAPSTLENEGS